MFTQAASYPPLLCMKVATRQIFSKFSPIKSCSFSSDYINFDISNFTFTENHTSEHEYFNRICNVSFAIPALIS